jgi:hypothetical protein
VFHKPECASERWRVGLSAGWRPPWAGNDNPVVDATQGRLNEVGRQYAQWLAMPFPAGLRGVDLANVSMVLLDADVVGCVQSWLANGGELDAARWDWLGRCLEDLDRVVPLLSREEDVAYFDACRTVGLLVQESEDPTSADSSPTRPQ